MEKTNQLYVFPALAALAGCHSTTTSFDLWMSKGAYDEFTLVIYFLSSDWQPKHVTIGFIEATKTRQALNKV